MALSNVIADLVARVGWDVDDRELKQMDATVDRVSDGMGRLRTAIAGLGVGLLAGGIIRANAEYERGAAALETITGSAREARSEMERLQSFAAATPFQQSEIVEAYTRLSSMGLDASDEMLTSLGNTSSAMGRTLMQATEALADAVTGEFERLKEFGIRASAQGDEVAFTFQGVTTTIGRNANEISEYLRSIGQNEFAGGMLRQAETFDGRVSTLIDNLKVSAISFMQTFKDETGDLLVMLTDMARGAIPAVETLGRILQPLLRSLVGAFRTIAGLGIGEFFSDLTERLGGAENIAALLRTALMGLVGYQVVTGFIGLARAIGSGVTAMRALGTAGLAAQAKVLAIPLAIAGIALAIEDFITWLQGGDSLIGPFVEEYSDDEGFFGWLARAIIWLRDNGVPIWQSYIAYLGRAWNAIQPVLSWIIGAVVDLARFITGRLGRSFSFLFDVIGVFVRLGRMMFRFYQRVFRTIAGVVNWFGDRFQATSDRIRGIWDWVTGGMQSDALERFGMIGRIFGGIIDAVRPVVEWLWDAGRSLFGFWLDGFSTILEGVASLAGAIGDRIGIETEGLDNIADRVRAFSDDMQRPMPGLLGIGGGANGNSQQDNSVNVGALQVEIQGSTNMNGQQVAQAAERGFMSAWRDQLQSAQRTQGAQ